MVIPNKASKIQEKNVDGRLECWQILVKEVAAARRTLAEHTVRFGMKAFKSTCKKNLEKY